MQSILQQQGEEMCPSGAIPARGSWASRGTICGESALEEASGSTWVAGSNPSQQQAGLSHLGKENLL